MQSPLRPFSNKVEPLWSGERFCDTRTKGSQFENKATECNSENLGRASNCLGKRLGRGLYMELFPFSSNKEGIDVLKLLAGKVILFDSVNGKPNNFAPRTNELEL